MRASWLRRTRVQVALVCVVLASVAGCTSSGAATGTPPGGGTPVWTSAPGISTTRTPSTDAHNWLRFDYDPAHSGVNPDERQITAATVGKLQRIWQAKLPTVADSSPIYLHGVKLPDGTMRNVVYVTTKDGRIVALDASDGNAVWSQQPPGPRYTTSSPVADPSQQYVYSYGLDGFVHKFHAGSGVEVTGNGWPAQVTNHPQTGKGSSALDLADGWVYVTVAGYPGDAPPYQGHVVALSTTGDTEHVFNALCANIAHVLTPYECNDQQAGIWSRAGTVVDPVTGDVFVATGNGMFNADDGGHDYGDSILELSPDVSRLIDSYTPMDYHELDTSDTDLGSTSPALLPRIPHSSIPYLLVQGGKDSKLRLVNRQDMSGQDGPGHVGGAVAVMQSQVCAVFTQPVVWQDTHQNVWLFVAGTCGLGAYQVRVNSAGTPSLQLVWKHGSQGTSPILAGGVLFLETSGNVLAYDPTSGKQLWSSTQVSAHGTVGDVHWESPIVVNGRLFVLDESGDLTAYALPG